MHWPDLPWKPTQRALRQFSAAWRHGFARGHPAAGRILALVSLVGVLGLIQPSSVRWLFVAATAIAFPIGWLVTQLVLLVMFYLVLTPVALVFRWRGRDELQLRGRPARSSFWIEREKPPEPGRYLKQY